MPKRVLKPEDILIRLEGREQVSLGEEKGITQGGATRR